MVLTRKLWYTSEDAKALLNEASQLAWRALIWSQELHEKYGGAPLAPGARLPSLVRRGEGAVLEATAGLSEEWADAANQNQKPYKPYTLDEGPGY